MSKKPPGPIRRLTAPPEQIPTLAEMLQAINHPLRREILRALHEAGEARSPRELSQILLIPLSNLSYHVRVLQSKGVIALTDRRQVRGSVEHFYASVLPSDAMIMKLLASTAQDDRTP